MQQEQKVKYTFPFYIKITAILVGLLLFFAMLDVGATIFIPLAVALLMAIILHPVANGLRGWGLPNLVAILISIFLLFTLLGAILYMVVIQLIAFAERAPELAIQLEALLNNLQVLIATRFGVDPAVQLEYMQRISEDFLNQGIGDILSSTLNTASSLVIALGLIPIYTFLFLHYRRLFKNFVLDITPTIRDKKIDRIFKQSSVVLQTYIGGMLTVMLVQATFNAAALYLIGVDYAVFFGVVAAMLTIIPYLGIFIGIAIPVLYSLITTGSFQEPLIILVAFVLIQALQFYIITPVLVKSQVRLSPLAVLVALFLGWLVWGPMGLILFVPYLAIIKIILDHFEHLRPYGKLLEGHRTSKRWKRMRRLVGE